MLSREDNELLTRVGPGTPMGNLFRRFWLPALLSSEMTPDSPARRLRILCEDLVAFRDSNGTVGIVDAYCAHRRVPLFFGRNEECGLRCPYHGWKFDVNGHCLEIPNVSVPRDTTVIRQKLGIKSYPAREAGGVVWIYMGPKEFQADLPQLEWTQVPPASRHVSRWIQRSNFMQGVEGEIDSSHISFLHKEFDPTELEAVHRGKDLASHGAPELTLHETDYGFRYGARRDLEGDNFWRLTQWLLPMYSLIPKAPGAYTHGGGRAWVPIDDHHTTTFSYNFRVDGPLTADEVAVFESGEFFPPRLEPGTYKLADGYLIDTFLPKANRDNDYLLDREIQRTRNFTGIHGANEQDRSLQEGMESASAGSGSLVDRTKEHLMGSDLAVVTARRRLIKMARDLQQGIEPAVAAHGEQYAVRAISKVCDLKDFTEFEARFQADLSVPGSLVEETPQ